MGFLRDLLLGKEQFPLKKKEKKSIKEKEREAYLKGLTQARITRAKEKGRKKGVQKQRSPIGRIGASLEGASLAAKGYMEMFDLGLGQEPKKRKTKRKKKKKTRTIIIKV